MYGCIILQTISKKKLLLCHFLPNFMTLLLHRLATWRRFSIVLEDNPHCPLWNLSHPRLDEINEKLVMIWCYPSTSTFVSETHNPAQWWTHKKSQSIEMRSDINTLRCVLFANCINYYKFFLEGWFIVGNCTNLPHRIWFVSQGLWDPHYVLDNVIPTSLAKFMVGHVWLDPNNLWLCIMSFHRVFFKASMHCPHPCEMCANGDIK